jgi:hypothetical protein
MILRHLRPALALAALATLLAVTAPATAAGPRAAIAQCGLVLKKLDFSQSPNYPPDAGLYTNFDALARDTQAVQDALTDPVSHDGWCEMIATVLTLASTSGVYFSDAPNNPARDEYVRDFSKVRALASCE